MDRTDAVPGAACVDAPLLVIVLVHDTVIVVVGEEIVAREVCVDVGTLGQGQPVPSYTVYTQAYFNGLNNSVTKMYLFVVDMAQVVHAKNI